MILPLYRCMRAMSLRQRQRFIESFLIFIALPHCLSVMSLIHRTGNIFEQQARNTRVTNVLIALFVLYFFIIGYGTDLFLFNTDALGIFDQYWMGFPWATAVAVVLASIYAGYSFYRGDELILHSVNLDRVWEEVPKEELVQRVWLEDNPNNQLVHVVQEMSIAAGIPIPAIYVIQDRDPNAFATGRDPFHASLAVTQGLLKSLTREELQAVVAHELAHIRNRDTRLMMMVATLTAGNILLARYAQARGLTMVSRLRIAGGFALFFGIWVGMVILTPLFTRYLSMAISREREYQADVEASLLTRNPEDLMKALQKVEDYMGQTRSFSIAISHLCITDPKGRYFQVEDEGFFRRWFMTHPPIAKRLAALREMALIYGSKPDAATEKNEETF
jgi:heat shock protein HtpX